MRYKIASSMLAAVLLTSGCAGVRQNIGWWQGTRAYAKAKKNKGVLPRGFGSGYLGAMSFYKGLDDLDKLKDEMKVFLEELEEYNKKAQKERGL